MDNIITLEENLKRLLEVNFKEEIKAKEDKNPRHRSGKREDMANTYYSYYQTKWIILMAKI